MRLSGVFQSRWEQLKFSPTAERIPDFISIHYGYRRFSLTYMDVYIYCMENFDVMYHLLQHIGVGSTGLTRAP